MHNSSKRPAIAIPRPDFPHFPHATGRWAKKAKGALLYFGPTATDRHGDAGMAAWLTEKDYCLLHGHRPQVSKGDLTVGELCERPHDHFDVGCSWPAGVRVAVAAAKVIGGQIDIHFLGK